MLSPLPHLHTLKLRLPLQCTGVAACPAGHPRPSSSAHQRGAWVLLPWRPAVRPSHRTARQPRSTFAVHRVLGAHRWDRQLFQDRPSSASSAGAPPSPLSLSALTAFECIGGLWDESGTTLCPLVELLRHSPLLHVRILDVPSNLLHLLAPLSRLRSLVTSTSTKHDRSEYALPSECGRFFHALSAAFGPPPLVGGRNEVTRRLLREDCEGQDREPLNHSSTARQKIPHPSASASPTSATASCRSASRRTQRPGGLHGGNAAPQRGEGGEGGAQAEGVRMQ